MELEPLEDPRLPLLELGSGSLRAQKVLPRLLALLVAVARSARQYKVAEMIPSLGHGVVDVTVAVLAAQCLSAICASALEVIPE